MKEREMEGCTFKPEILKYNSNKDIIRSDIQVPRYDTLYKKGTQMITARKDKTKDQVDEETYKKELSFKPNTAK
jgi:hypothetical protein